MCLHTFCYARSAIRVNNRSIIVEKIATSQPTALLRHTPSSSRRSSQFSQPNTSLTTSKMKPATLIDPEAQPLLADPPTSRRTCGSS